MSSVLELLLWSKCSCRNILSVTDLIMDGWLLVFCWPTLSHCPMQCPKYDAGPIVLPLFLPFLTAITTNGLRSDSPVSQSSLLDANAMWPLPVLHLSWWCQGHLYIYSALSVWNSCTQSGAQWPSFWYPDHNEEPSQAPQVINNLFQLRLCWGEHQKYYSDRGSNMYICCTSDWDHL